MQSKNKRLYKNARRLAAPSLASDADQFRLALLFIFSIRIFKTTDENRFKVKVFANNFLRWHTIKCINHKKVYITLES